MEVLREQEQRVQGEEQGKRSGEQFTDPVQSTSSPGRVSPRPPSQSPGSGQVHNVMPKSDAISTRDGSGPP